jgi:hypothetical protein
MQSLNTTASRSEAAAPDLRPSFSAGGAVAEASIEPFLRRGAAVDPLGLTTVLTLGYALGGRTVLRGVSTDAIAPTGFAAERMPSDSDVVDLAMEAVRRALPKAPPTVLLSGGRDSRLILLAMLRLGVRPRAVLTLDQRGPESDAAIAQRLARAVGERAERVAPLAFDAGRELTRHRSQSFQSLEHEWFVAVAERVRSGQGPVTDGIGAGVLSTGSLLDPEAVALWRRGALEGLFEWTGAHGAHVSQRFLDAARAEGLPLASRAEVLAEFVRVLEELRATPNPLGMYSLLHWTRRGIGASAYGLLPRARVVTPLYDRTLCRAIAAIPLEQAMARDWRETVLARLDGTGVPFSVREGGLVPRWMRAPLRTVRSRLAWRGFVRGLPAPLARLAAVADAGRGMERTFDRGAVGLLASLDDATGFLSGSAGR